MTETLLDRVASDLGRLQFRYFNEFTLQDALEAALTNLEYQVEREVRVSGEDRLDFAVVEGDEYIALEVKVAGAAGRVNRQLERYAKHPFVTGVLLVTTRLKHQPPPEMNGKPVRVVALTLSAL